MSYAAPPSCSPPRERDERGRGRNEGHIRGRGLLVARRHTAKRFDSAEPPLDDVARSIARAIESPTAPAMASRRDHDAHLQAPHVTHERIAVVGAVADDAEPLARRHERLSL